MVKPRKTGLKAPPRVHAGESVPDVAEIEAPDAGVVDDARTDEIDASSRDGAGDSAEVALVEADVEVARAGESMSEETGLDDPAIVADVLDLTGPVDALTVPDGEAGSGEAGSGEAQADAGADEPGEPVEPTLAAPADPLAAPADPLAAVLAAAAAPRAAPPGVVLSDELPIDPDDDLRAVEGEASARLVSILESLLFSAAKPLSVKDLRKVLQETSQRQIQLALRHLMEVTRSRGVVLAQVAGGFQFRTHPDNALWVQKMLQAKPAKLSRTQIETLAIVAYRQPVTRPEIDDIRGVDSGAVLKSLLERELIQIVGKKDEPGRPLLYGTTVRFLEFFNLRGLRDLPTLRDFRDLSEESKATLRDRLGDLQFAEALGQEVLELGGADGHGPEDRAQEPGTPEQVVADEPAGDGAAADAADAGAVETATDGALDAGEPGEAGGDGPSEAGASESGEDGPNEASASEAGDDAPEASAGEAGEDGPNEASARQSGEDAAEASEDASADDGEDADEPGPGRDAGASGDGEDADEPGPGRDAGAPDDSEDTDEPGPGRDAGAPDDAGAGEPEHDVDRRPGGSHNQEEEPRGGSEEQT